MRRICLLFLSALLFTASTAAALDSFQRIKVPDSDGKLVKAMLVFNDVRKVIQVDPMKGSAVTIPYDQIDKFVYEYTKHHRVNRDTIATAPVGVGAVAMLTKSRTHWLEIDYHEQDVSKVYLVRMDKRNYLRILEAVKKHTGKDAEVLGNADKRH